MKKLLTFAFACFSAGFANLAAAESESAIFDKVAEEYIQGYLAARPLQATALGFHQYDGKIATVGFKSTRKLPDWTSLIVCKNLMRPN